MGLYEHKKGRSLGHLVVDSHNVDEDIDPGQRQSKKLDPDSDPHRNEKLNSDPHPHSHQSETHDPHKSSRTLKNGKNKYDIPQGFFPSLWCLWHCVKSWSTL